MSPEILLCGICCLCSEATHARLILFWRFVPCGAEHVRLQVIFSKWTLAHLWSLLITVAALLHDGVLVPGPQVAQNTHKLDLLAPG